MNLDDALKVVRQFRSDDLHVLGSIPSKKLDNARLLYPVDSEDTVFALVDATVFGSAKCGMAMGLKGIYWKNDWTTPTGKNFLDWSELSRHADSLSSSFMEVTLAPGCKFNISGSQLKSDQLIELIKRLCAETGEINDSGMPRQEGGIQDVDVSGATPEPPTSHAQAPTSDVSLKTPKAHQAPQAEMDMSEAEDILSIRQPDKLFGQIKSLNTMHGVVNFLTGDPSERQRNTTATNAFLSYMVRALSAFRKHVVQKRSVPQLSNDLATLEACCFALGVVVRIMKGRHVPDVLVKQIFSEGVRSTLNIHGLLQDSPVGMIAIRLAGIYEDVSNQGPQVATSCLARRLIGSNLAGEISVDYNIVTALVAVSGNEVLLQKTTSHLMPGLVVFQKEVMSEANLFVGRVLDLFPHGHIDSR